MKKMIRWTLFAVVIAAVNSQFAVRSYAGLFKIDFGQLENEREIVDADGNPTGMFPEVLTNWNVIATWTFADPNVNVVTNTASILGTTNATGTEVTWKLTDFSTSGDNDVTLTMLDNKALSEQVNMDAPPYLLGQTANNPTKEGLDAVYDGILVPHVVKDDYLYRNPDTAGTETLMRFANLNPGFYNVTVFEGRTTDTGRYGKVWVDDINGKNEPAAQNTGNYAGENANGVAVLLGQPRTVTVQIKAGDYLWFAEMEDNSGGISGMIIRSVASAPPPIDITTSKGLFKIDFGQLENERIPTDADGNATGPAPDPLKDWNVIPTWTFTDPNANVTPGSASISGTANADGSEVTWNLTDFSKDANKNVTMTMLDNKALAEQLTPDSPPYLLGQTANNPTKEGVDEVYDGVLVPAIVKDDYNYRNPDTAGTEVLMRFANLNPGTYNVTVFEGRTTDSNGRFGKVWVDDIKGAKEPAAQNTGNYAGVTLDVGGIATPAGSPQTVTVDIKAGDYLWFAEMEDNSGGISGMIIRGTGGTSPVQIPLPAAANLQLWLSADKGVTATAGSVSAWADQSGNLNNAAQSTNKAQPQLIANAVNTMPVIRFDGTNDYLIVPNSPSVAIAGDITTFFVVKFDDFATYRAVWAKTTSNLPAANDWYALPNTGLPRAYRGNGTMTSLGSVDGAKPLTAGAYLIVGWDMAGTTLHHYLNGQTNGVGQITAALADAGKPLLIGTRDDLFTKMKGDIAEIIIYNTALSDADRGKVVDYLSGKYGLPVSAGGPQLAVSHSGNNLTFSWPDSFTGFILEVTDQLAPATWIAVTDPIVVSGGSSTVTVLVTPTGGNRFYRLRK